jgi:hypothetical protein
MSDVATKVCRFCAKDVSGEARIKDKKGRYACQPCFERLKEKREQTQQIPEPKANPYSAFDDGVDTEAIALDIDTSSMPSAQQPMKACPTCKAMLGASDVFCVQCGTNVQTGGKLGKAKVKKAKPRREKHRNGDLGTISLVGSLVFASALGVCMLIGGSAGDPSPVQMISTVLFMCYSAATGLLTLGHAFKQDGVLQMFAVWLIPFYVLYWVYGRAESAMLKLHFTLVLLLYIPWFVAMSSIGRY